MRFVFPGDELGDRPIYQRQNLKNPHAGDEDAPEHHQRAIESVVNRIKFPEGMDPDASTIGKIRHAVNYAVANNRGTNLQALREHLRASEGIPDALFDTTLLREQQVAVLDGFETPAFTAHREFMVVGEPFNDYRKVQLERFTRVPDFETMSGPREEVPAVHLAEQDGAIIGPALWFSQQYEFDWELSTVADLMNMYRAMFDGGEAANRTLEKYVFNTNLATGASGPSFQVDGSTVSLFADHSTLRGVNNAVDTGGPPTDANIDTVVGTMSGATMDGEPLAKSFGMILARTGGTAWRQAARTLNPRADKDVDNANNTPNIFGPGREIPFRLVGIDLDEWTTSEWYSTFDFRRSPSLGFQMRWHRGLNTPVVVDLDGPGGSRVSRQTMGRDFLVRMVGAGSWADVAGIYRGDT